MKLVRSALLVGCSIVLGMATPTVYASTYTERSSTELSMVNDTRQSTPTQPYAAVSCEDPISAGLWQGASLEFDLNYSSNCDPNYSATAPEPSVATVDQPEQVAKPSAPVAIYAALGDSVAAGLGLPQSSDSDPACGVSAQAYPDYVAGRTGLTYMNLACSGATVGDLVTEQHLSGTSRDIEPQLNNAFFYGTPQLITITAGANDLYWQTYLRKCYASTCGTKADQTIVDGLRATMAFKLRYALQSIQSRSGGAPPRVVLTGYYQPFSTACAAQQSSITLSEINWLNGQLAALNQTIASVVGEYAFAQYAPVDFSGHELCTADSWVQGIDSPAPLHPTAAGQRAIAESVLLQSE